VLQPRLPPRADYGSGHDDGAWRGSQEAPDAAERQSPDEESAVPSATAFSDTISAAAAGSNGDDSGSNGSSNGRSEGGGEGAGAGGTEKQSRKPPPRRHLHPVATTEALVSLATFGGPVAFQDEMEAVIRVLPHPAPPRQHAVCPQVLIASARKLQGGHASTYTKQPYCSRYTFSCYVQAV